MFENILETIQNFDYIGFVGSLFSNITLEGFLKIIVLYFFIVWISIIIWVTRDIINRTHNLFFQIISILIPVLLTPFGLIIYLLIRPSRTLFEKEFEIDSTPHIELLAQDTEKHHCFNCNFEVKKDYIYCPNCKTKLKHNCTKCKKEIDSNFKNCPYCGEEQSKKEEKSKEIKREKDDTKVLVLKDEKEVIYKMDDLLKELNIDGIIRLEHLDFESLNSETFAHFNLEKTTHIVGKKYGLMKIIRKGFYNDETKEEQLPLLDYSIIKKYECIEVKNNISYNDFDIKLFENSLYYIKDVFSLKEAIIKRYSVSMPNLTSNDIVKLGVGFTLLKQVQE